MCINRPSLLVVLTAVSLEQLISGVAHRLAWDSYIVQTSLWMPCDVIERETLSKLAMYLLLSLANFFSFDRETIFWHRNQNYFQRYDCCTKIIWQTTPLYCTKSCRVQMVWIKCRARSNHVNKERMDLKNLVELEKALWSSSLVVTT